MRLCLILKSIPCRKHGCTKLLGKPFSRARQSH
jgi:hypothetical protein